MAICINMTPYALPTPAKAMKFADRRKRDDLERRSSLASKDRKNDLEPLNEDEEREYLTSQVLRRVESVPLAGGIELKFAPLGARGCMRELAYPMANHLSRTWRIRFRGHVTQIIRILGPDEKPADVLREAIELWNGEHPVVEGMPTLTVTAGAEIPTPQATVTAPRDDPRYKQERPSQGAAAGTFFNRQVEGPRVRA